MIYKVHHFMNGKATPGQSGKSGDLYNPATGELTGHVSYANKNEIETALQAAKTAYSTWSSVPLMRRSAIFFKFKELIEKNMNELATLITKEHGKLLSDAKASISRGLEVVGLVSSIPLLLRGYFSENIATNVDSYSMRQPLGVCVGISPFNFPAMIPLWMFPMAIACGNTFILKPSEKNPSVSVRLAELLHEAGLPNGVLNILQGDQETVHHLITHPDVKAISFVGSSNVAQSIYTQATARNKRVQAFGSAKNHCLVMPDVDLEQTAEAIIGAAFGSAGERCMAISVVVVVGEESANKLIDKLSPLTRALNIGPGIKDNVDMGPLVTHAHLDRVRNYVQLGVEEGAKLIVDGRQHKVPGNENGFYLGGCLFDYVKPEMKIYQEEIFGPVLSVVRVKTFEEGVRLISQHQFGNAASIFTANGGIAREFASQVKAGMVGINVPTPVPTPFHSFGGWKDSIFGDINMHGNDGVNFYTQIKTVTTRWPNKQKLDSQFVLPTN